MSDRACKICEQLKPAVEFYARKDGSSSHQCKTCQRAAAKKRQRALKRTPEGIARYKAVKAKFRASEKGKESRKKERRTYNKKQSMMRPLSRKAQLSLKKRIRKRLEAGRLSEVKAWKDYLHNVASDEFLDSYYQGTGKRDHRLNYSEYIRKTNREAFRHRYQSDPQFNAMQKVRSTVKKMMTNKRKSTYELVGYNAKQLTDAIESKFTDGMSWDKFIAGDIHIDHIVPKCLFDHTIEEEVRDCWSLDNLQPLWAEDNLLKSDSIDINNSPGWLLKKYEQRILELPVKKRHESYDGHNPSRVGHLAFGLSRIYCNFQNSSPAHPRQSA